MLHSFTGLLNFLKYCPALRKKAAAERDTASNVSISCKYRL